MSTLLQRSRSILLNSTRRSWIPKVMESSGARQTRPRSSATTSSIATVESTAPPSSNILDDPCWGGPEQHDLSDLLKLIDKPSCILHESNDLLVMNKPPDLRMDGPYPSTVHKLLTYWYPPPSISQNSNENLLETVSKLAKHNDLNDNALRVCHQLDYATSGVLCVARTKSMAATVCQAFEQRRVQKVYLALVHGHVKLVQDEELPCIDKARVEAVFDNAEYVYRKTRAKQSSTKANSTFVGYLPPSTIYVKFTSLKTKRRRQAQNNQANTPKKKKKYKHKKTTVLSDDEFESLCHDVLSGCLSVDQQEEMLDKKWSKLTKDERKPFEELSRRYNDALKKKLDQEKQTSQPTEPTLPTLFRVKEDTDKSAFYINAELAEVKNDFRVRLHPKGNYVLSSNGPSSSLAACGAADLDYKPSLTRCVVLQYGYMNGMPVTKVRLEPKTGRRHQLRLHMVAIQHLIVGDVTYEFAVAKNNGQNKNDDLCSRMCLHAHSLSVPTEDETLPFSFVAPDPFLVEDRNDRVDFKVLLSNCFEKA